MHVVLYHCSGDLRPYLSGLDGLTNLLATGPNSVGFFFVLSGFILAYTYLGPPEERRLRWRDFWAARFARVYPVYALGLLFAAPLVLLTFHSHATGWELLGVGAAVATLVQAWIPKFALAWNSPGWSLSAEAFFYLTFPFVAPWLWRVGRSGLWVALVGFWALALLGPALFTLAEAQGAMASWGGQSNAWTAIIDYNPRVTGQNPWVAFVLYAPLVRWPEFLFGVALGRFYLAQQGDRGDRAEKGTLLSPHAGAWLAVVGGILVLVALACSSAILQVVPGLFLNNGLITPLYGLVIFGLASARGTGLARLLSRSTLVLLGEASYALYILHLPVRAWFRLTLRTPPTSPWPPLVLVGYLAVVVILSIVVLRWVEEPTRQWLRRRLTGAAR